MSTIDYNYLLSSTSFYISCSLDRISDYFTLIGLNMFTSSIFLRMFIRDELYLSSQFFRPFLINDSDISFQFYPFQLQYREGSIPSAQHRHIIPAMLTGFISWSGSQGVMASSSTDSSKNNMKHTYFVMLERLQTKSLQNIPRNDFDTILTHQQYIIEIHILHSLIFLLTIFYIPQQIDHKRPQKILRWKFLFFMI